MTSPRLRSELVGWGSVSAPAQDDGGDGLDQNFEIAKHAAAFDIFDVEPDLLVEGELGAASDLPEAGQAGGNLQTASIFVGVKLDFARQGRPGADEGHIALEDIDQLGQLVEAGAAEDAAEGGDSRVALHFEGAGVDVLVELGELVLEAVGVADHGAELVEAEDAFVLTDPVVSVEDRAAILQPDDQGDQGEDRDDERQGKHADGDVDAALDHFVGLHAESTGVLLGDRGCRYSSRIKADGGGAKIRYGNGARLCRIRQ